MNKISNIGGLLKKIYRNYSNLLLVMLQERGFTDLRPSFLEVMLFICEEEGTSIRMIGESCGLKKQTMTSHLNELANRGYIVREVDKHDKRSQNIFLTEYGQKFKLSLIDCTGELEQLYIDRIGDVELDRIELLLNNFFKQTVR